MKQNACGRDLGVKIRLIRKEDTPNIVAWRNNERVRNNFIFQEIFTEEMHNNWMDTKVASGDVVQFIIETAETAEPVGSVYFRDIRDGRGEYGIFIGEDSAIGKGYGKQAAKLALAYAFDELKLEYIFLRVFADNISAIKSYERAGFHEYERGEVEINGRMRPIVFMEVTRQEFDCIR